MSKLKSAAALLGSKGGRKRAQNLSKADRSKAASQAAKARWKDAPQPGIGYTLVQGEWYELCTAGERRVMQGGEYRQYSTPEEAVAAARKLASRRKVRYIGEVR